LKTSVEIFFAASIKRDAEVQPAIVQEEITEEERKALDAIMLQSIIEVSLQGSDVAVSSDSIETDLAPCTFV